MSVRAGLPQAGIKDQEALAPLDAALELDKPSLQFFAQVVPPERVSTTVCACAFSNLLHLLSAGAVGASQPTAFGEITVNVGELPTHMRSLC